FSLPSHSAFTLVAVCAFSLYLSTYPSRTPAPPMISTLSLHDALPILLLVYELNRSGLLAENEKIRPILAQLEKLLLCDLRKDRSDRKSGSAGMPRPTAYAVFCLNKKSRCS